MYITTLHFLPHSSLIIMDLSIAVLIWLIYGVALGDSLLCSVLKLYDISQFECKHDELIPIIGASGSQTTDSGLFVCEIIIPYDPEKDECKNGAIIPLNFEEHTTRAPADYILNELKIAATTSTDNMGTSPNSDITSYLIGGVIGGVAVMVIIGISILCYRRQRQNRNKTDDSTDSMEKETWV